MKKMVTWQSEKGQFEINSKPVPEQKLRLGLQMIIKRSEERMSQLSEQMKTGKISLQQWQARSQNEIRYIHAVASASALGGFSKLTQKDKDVLAERTAEQLKYFNKFGQDVQSGKQKLTGKVNFRARAFSRSACGTYFFVRTFNRIAEALRLSKRLQIRRVLGQAEHCSDCQQQVSLGWMESGDARFQPIGQSRCRFNCKCVLIYRMV